MRALSTLTGNEHFKGSNELKILDFWRWSYSTIGNSFIRGYLAEFIALEALKCNQPENEELRIVENKAYKDHFTTKMEGDVHDLIVYQEHDGEIYRRTIQVKSTDSIRNTYDLECVQGYNCKEKIVVERKENWSDIFILCKVEFDKDKILRIKELNELLNGSLSESDYDKLSKEHESLTHEYRDLHLDLRNWKFSIVCTYAVDSYRKKVRTKYNNKNNTKKDRESFVQSKSDNKIDDFKEINVNSVCLDIRYDELREKLDELMFNNFQEINRYSRRLSIYDKDTRHLPINC